MHIDLPLQDIGNDVIIALDFTGMKVPNRGEWMRHKWKVRKGWIKVHIAVEPLVEKAKRTIGNKKIERMTEMNPMIAERILVI